MPKIICSSYRLAAAAIEEFNPSYVVSIYQPNLELDMSVFQNINNHLILRFDDIVEYIEDLPEQYQMPTEGHIKQLIDFGKKWDGSGNILIHCKVGVSRSSAATLILGAAAFPAKLKEFAILFREQAPWVKPNPLLLNMADEILMSGGSLESARKAMGGRRMRGVVRAGVVSFDLPSD